MIGGKKQKKMIIILNRFKEKREEADGSKVERIFIIVIFSFEKTLRENKGKRDCY